MSSYCFPFLHKDFSLKFSGVVRNYRFVKPWQGVMIVSVLGSGPDVSCFSLWRFRLKYSVVVMFGF